MQFYSKNFVHIIVKRTQMEDKSSTVLLLV